MKVYHGQPPFYCGLCEQSKIKESANGYCPDCNILLSSKCWVTHHKRIGIKTHKAWALPQISDTSPPVAPSNPPKVESNHSQNIPTPTIHPPDTIQQPIINQNPPKNQVIYLTSPPLPLPNNDPIGDKNPPDSSSDLQKTHKDKIVSPRKVTKEAQKAQEKEAKLALKQASKELSKQAKDKKEKDKKPKDKQVSSSSLKDKTKLDKHASKSLDVPGDTRDRSSSTSSSDASPRRGPTPERTSQHTQQQPPPVKTQAPEQLKRPPVGLTRGQSALLHAIHNNNNNNTLPPPSPSKHVAYRPSTGPSSMPCYQIIGLESDIKSSDEYSGIGDNPLLISENIVRLLSGFSQSSVNMETDSGGEPIFNINFETFSSFSLPIVGIHGNKDEILLFLEERTSIGSQSLSNTFNKPGIYAIVGKSFSNSGKSSTTSNDPLVLYLVLWHTSDAFLERFTTPSKNLQLFHLLNAISTYRICLYSETEAKLLLSIEKEALAAKAAGADVRAIPSKVDATVNPHAEGTLATGKTTVIQLAHYLPSATLPQASPDGTLPVFKLLSGTNGVAFHISTKMKASSAGSNSHGQLQEVINLKIEDVPKSLADWGPNGIVDLSLLSDDEFGQLLSDGAAPDWQLRLNEIASKQRLAEALDTIPQFTNLESLLDYLIRAHMRCHGNVGAMDEMFQLEYNTAPKDKRASFMSHSQTNLAATYVAPSADSDELILSIFSNQIDLAGMSPENPYWVALTRFAIAKSALKLVRVLRSKTPEEQTSFILNTMDSTEDEVNTLLESLEGFPEFEKVRYNFLQTADLSAEPDPRIRSYFVVLYDHIVVQAREYLLHTLSAKNITFDMLKLDTTEHRQKFLDWKTHLIANYRSDLNTRLTGLYEFRVLGINNPDLEGQERKNIPQRLSITSYKRDESGKSVSISFIGSATQTSSSLEHNTIILLHSTNWLAGDLSRNAGRNEAGLRIIPAAVTNFTVTDSSNNSKPNITTSNSNNNPNPSIYYFYSSILNVVIKVSTSKSKNQTQIFGAGGSLIGTLPVYCNHIAYSDDSNVISFVGDYLQLYRLLDGCSAMSSVPILSVYIDVAVYGVVQQVLLVGDSCFFYTTMQALPQNHSNTSTNNTMCHLYKSSPSGVCVRLSSSNGIVPFSRMAVLPNQEHVLLFRAASNGMLQVETWHLSGMNVSIYPTFIIEHPFRNVDSVNMVTLNGSLYLISSSPPEISGNQFSLMLYMTHIFNCPSDPQIQYDQFSMLKCKNYPCENYLTYFAEDAMKFTPSPAFITASPHVARFLDRRKKTFLRVLVRTKDNTLFNDFLIYIDRVRMVLRQNLIDIHRFDVKSAATEETDSGLAPKSPFPSSKGPVIPYLHISVMKVKQTQHFANSSSDDIAEEAAINNLAMVIRTLVCLIPTPLISSNSSGRLVPCISGGVKTIPFGAIMAIKASDKPEKRVVGPIQLSQITNFGLFEVVLKGWPGQCKIVSSFGAVGTGKTTLLNNLFGTCFDAQPPNSPESDMVQSIPNILNPPIPGLKKSGAASIDNHSPIAAFMSLIPTTQGLLIVIDFDKIISRRPQNEQLLLSLFNIGVSNLTLWRSTTPFVDEHYLYLRKCSMEKERLLAWSQSTGSGVLPWPKSYNSLLIISDTSKVNNIAEARTVHQEMAKSVVKHFEGKPGPHSKPVLNSLFRNRIATEPLPLPRDELPPQPSDPKKTNGNINSGSNNVPPQNIFLGPKNWTVGFVKTNYFKQATSHYQQLNDNVVPFLGVALPFNSGADALNHLKRHLSYIIWSQTAPQEVPNRLESAVDELDALSTNALIFGQIVRTGTLLRKLDAPQLMVSSIDPVTNAPFTIEPLNDLSDPKIVVGCPTIDFSLISIPEPITKDYLSLQQYFPEEGLVLPIGMDPLPFNPQSQHQWSYYSYIDVVHMFNSYVCNREHVMVDVDWVTSLQLFLNTLITRRATRVDYWITLHTADVSPGSPVYRKVAVLRERLACHFDKIKHAWHVCGLPCNNCYYICTLQHGHSGNHDCLVPNNHACTGTCPKCNGLCPVPSGHRRDRIGHKCPNNCKK